MPTPAFTPASMPALTLDACLIRCATSTLGEDLAGELGLADATGWMGTTSGFWDTKPLAWNLQKARLGWMSMGMKSLV